MIKCSKFTNNFCQSISKFQKSGGGGQGGGEGVRGTEGVLHLPTPSQLARPSSHHIKKSLQLLLKSCFSLDQENFDCPPITTLYISSHKNSNRAALVPSSILASNTMDISDCNRYRICFEQGVS